MDSTIVASLISAVASVLVALISKANASARAAEDSSVAPAYVTPERNRKIWIAVVTILVVWMVYAALFLHWDTAGVTSTLAVPIVIWTLSAAYPLSPGAGAAVALFLFPLAFLAEPIGKWRRGISFANHFEPGWVVTFVGIAFGTALIAWLIAKWRRRSSRTRAQVNQPPVISSAIAKALSELAELHKTGVLSDEEFTRAKNKLLSE